MGLLDGKKAMIFGVLNEWSIAAHIAEALHREGATLAFSHMPGDKMLARVAKTTEKFAPAFLTPCDVQRDADITAAFAKIQDTWGSLDILIHSIAFAPREALEGEFLRTPREAFHTALDVSAYSLVALAREAAPLMAPGGAILTMTYMGSVKFIPRYNVMAVAKAALECSVRYLAAELGRPSVPGTQPVRGGGVRVNAVSAGPIKTLAASGIKDFQQMLEHYPTKAPLGRNVSADEVASAALYLCSPLASGVTGEIHYVDAGYSQVGW